MLRPESFFDLTEFEHKEIFSEVKFVWEALNKLKSYIKDTLISTVADINENTLLQTRILWNGDVLVDDDIKIVSGDPPKGKLRIFRNGSELAGASVVYAGATLFDSDIYIGKGTVVEPGALIKGPTIIGNNTEVRQGAYIRGNCIIGDGCVVGHTTELKTAIMLNGSKAGHFAYIGDSILGNGVNLGAGTKLANLKVIDFGISLKVDGEIYKTGLRKLGAILGDNVETGCNSVTNPGALFGKRSIVYPGVNVPGGYYPARSIIAQRTKKIISIRQLRPTS
jgi:bifunctional N-acetylglucosamine-1-phosphate-uridyltransferase/glucosamine-1-phosphate-acetyltransferase GlmU-like protein